MKNLTPHDIVVVLNGDEKVTFPKSGEIARVSVTDEVVGHKDGIEIVVSNFGDVVGVPEVGGEEFLVSAMVLSALPVEYKGQAFAPDTGASAIRNNDGQVVGVTRLKTV